MKNNIEYYGLVLEPSTHERLVRIYANYIPTGWRLFCHHMTIVHAADRRKDLQADAFFMLGENHSMIIHAIGISDRAVALRVVTDVHSAKEIKHITLAVAPGAKPVESNQITHWERIPYETVFGVVTAVPFNA